MAEATPPLRLFVALELPERLLQALEAIQRDLRSNAGEHLRMVRPEGIHLTLKFLGDVERDRRTAIDQALTEAVAPFTLELKPAKLGSFGGRRIRVVWVGLGGMLDELGALARAVDQAMVSVGFDGEDRPFAPHLTLARVRDRASDTDRARLADLVGAYHLPDLPEVVLSHAALVSSVLGPGGAKYETISRYPATAP